MAVDTLGGIAKLTIIPLRKNLTEQDTSVSLDESNKVECQFNPETLTLQKMNQWSFRRDMGDDVPEVIFSGGLSGSLSVKMLFDSTDTGNDVRDKYLKLLAMALVKPSDEADKKGQPQQVMVQWGNFMSFVAVIQSISQNFQLFKEDGTPLRAELIVRFRQAWDETKKGGQNPTSRTEVRSTWVVEQGQRLDWIAYQVYRDSSAWRHLAETNDLAKPSELIPGQILKIVPLP